MMTLSSLFLYFSCLFALARARHDDFARPYRRQSAPIDIVPFRNDTLNATAPSSSFGQQGTLAPISDLPSSSAATSLFSTTVSQDSSSSPFSSAELTSTDLHTMSDSSSIIEFPVSSENTPHTIKSSLEPTSNRAPLPIITPVELSTAAVSTLSGVSTDTQIRTTDSRGNEVVAPFFWKCWFGCGSGGMLLFGVGPAPGIYPPPMPPPFPELPTITIGHNGIPTAATSPVPTRPVSLPSDSPSKTNGESTETSCSEEVVTKTMVSCLASVSGTASESVSCITSFAPQTGCEIVGTVTTTTSTTSTTCSACQSLCTRLPTPTEWEQSDQEIDMAFTYSDDKEQKRSIAGRVSLDKRKAGGTWQSGPSITELGGCKLPNSVRLPRWPGGPALLKSDTSSKPDASLGFESMDRWYVAGLSGCIPTISKVSGQQLKDNAEQYKLLTPANVVPTLDHAYEKGWLRAFFDTMFNADNCGPMTSLLFRQCTNLQNIFDGLAGPEHLDFLGMSHYANNRWKAMIMQDQLATLTSKYRAWKVGAGYVWSGHGYPENKDGLPPAATKVLGAKLDLVVRVVGGSLLMRTPTNMPLMQATNNRLYGLLLRLDSELGQDLVAAQVGFASFADRYKTYMDDFAAGKNEAVALVRELISTTEKDIEASRVLPDVVEDELQIYSSKLNELKAFVANEDQWAFSLQWEWKATIPLARRAEACTKQDANPQTTVQSSSDQISTTLDTNLTPTPTMSVTSLPSTTTQRPNSAMAGALMSLWSKAAAAASSASASAASASSASVASASSASAAAAASSLAEASKTVEAPPPPPPTASCKVSWKADTMEYYIYGKAWDAAKLDIDGEPGKGVLEQTKTCGEITQYKYEKLPPGDRFDFEIYLHHWPQPLKSCMEKALVAAGAPPGAFCAG
ncbi:hypothetical protein BDZ85DRAFT_299667 [Elsinoe ampelina]|uniref:Uncharacterized protein n=1 Tax=Elsinoe ampelina TaxID=302913 RepID=A0A6A6FXZ6_9PEZI|nr:hypothetical protein BDZ85DRAFT_299667 [Elsinoe ampelina]